MSIRSNFILYQTCKRPLIGEISVGCIKRRVIHGGELDCVASSNLTSALEAKYCVCACFKIIIIKPVFFRFDKTEGIVVIGATNFPEVLDKYVLLRM